MGIDQDSHEFTEKLTWALNQPSNLPLDKDECTNLISGLNDLLEKYSEAPGQLKLEAAQFLNECRTNVIAHLSHRIPLAGADQFYAHEIKFMRTLESTLFKLLSDAHHPDKDSCPSAASAIPYSERQKTLNLLFEADWSNAIRGNQLDPSLPEGMLYAPIRSFALVMDLYARRNMNIINDNSTAYIEVPAEDHPFSL